MRDSFIFYRSFYEALIELENDDKLAVYEAIADYSLNQNLTELKGVAKAIFTLIKPQIDEARNLRDYKEISRYHWNWKGGISTENRLSRNSTKYKKWRQKILERDNFLCQKCFLKHSKLEVHHIKEFSKFKELRTDINNGITLCTKCHKEVHYG